LHPAFPGVPDSVNEMRTERGSLSAQGKVPPCAGSNVPGMSIIVAGAVRKIEVWLFLHAETLEVVASSFNSHKSLHV
jgi:hypothetical protein